MIEKLTQKWCIIALLEDIDKDYSFHMSEYPLHITLAGVHDVVWNEKLISEFEKCLQGVSAFTVEPTQRGTLGTTEVVLIDKSNELFDLHSQIIEILEANGAVFNNPEWQRDGYIPHYTIQNHASVATGQTLTIDNVVLVDMFHNQDGKQRKITKIFKLKNN
jgi:hypothetical protein